MPTVHARKQGATSGVWRRVRSRPTCDCSDSKASVVRGSHLFLCREDEDVAAHRRSNDSAPSSFTTDRSPSGARPPEPNGAAVRQTCGAAGLTFCTARRLLSGYAGAIAQVLPPEVKIPPVSIRLSLYVMGLLFTGSAPPPGTLPRITNTLSSVTDMHGAALFTG